MLAATTIVYYALQLAGLLLLGILTITFALPQGPSRHLTIPNQNLIWIIQAIVSCLLLFSGHADSEQIPQGLCKVQSAIVYGAPPALSAAALAVVARLWLLTFTVDKAKSLIVPNSPWFTVGLVALPYVAWIIVAVLAGVIAGENVRRFPQYCASDNQVPSIISGIGAAFLLVVAATLQIWTLVIVWARYRRTRKLGSREIGNIDVALFMRISMFSSLIVIALVLAIVAIVSSWSQAAPDLLIAGMGPICFFIFGTQRDVLVCWHMAKKQQFTTRSQTGTPGNTFASITAGQRSVPLGGVGSAGPAYGTDGWDMERDIAHQQAGIRSPTFVISSSNKRSMVDSDTEDIEMGDTKARQVDSTAGEEGLRTVRVLSFDPNAQPENHDLDDVPPTPPPKSYQI